MPVVPVLAAIGGGSAAAGGLALAGTVGGLALTAKGQSDARKAADAAARAATEAAARAEADAQAEAIAEAEAQAAAKAAAPPRPSPTVDINSLDAQAREFARRNAIEGMALENELSPELGRLRTGSVMSLINSIARQPGVDTISNRIAGQAGSEVEAGLLRGAIARSREELGLGGKLPLDVQNAVTRRGLATAGTVGGGLGLGRDVVARDLGLTSLDLLNRRLQTAGTLGAAEAGLQQEGRRDLYDSGAFLASLQSGDFARALAASQLGQSIATPQTGLDPSSVVNLAVGNTNALAQQAQFDATLEAIKADQAMQAKNFAATQKANLAANQAANLAANQAAAANQTSQIGSQLLGAGMGLLTNLAGKKPTPKPVAPKPAVPLPTFSTPYVPIKNYGLGGGG